MKIWEVHHLIIHDQTIFPLLLILGFGKRKDEFYENNSEISEFVDTKHKLYQKFFNSNRPKKKTEKSFTYHESTLQRDLKPMKNA